MSNYVLLTGATGLVGRYLMRDFLRQGKRFAVLVRPSRRQSARERIESICQMWEAETGSALPRPVCLEGDVGQDGFGLSARKRHWIEHHCDTLLHNAAVLEFHGSDRQGEPWQTNLEGTRRAVDLAQSLGVEHFHYVSTAYVCGRREGTVYEDELDVGQSFRNDYEHSKFLAEKLVRRAKFAHPPTIYRPVVIAGDSQTGYTNTYHGLYLYLRLMSMLMQNMPPDETGIRRVQMRLNLNGDELRNVVPIDWVSQVICQLYDTPEAHGGTYHLAPQKPLTPRETLDAAGNYLGSTGVEFCAQEKIPVEQMNELEKIVYESISIYNSYDTTDPRFDTTNLLKYTADIPCPTIDESMLHRYLRFGEEDRWGKRRTAPVEVPCWIEELLAPTAATAGCNGSASPSMCTIGLDILGPGGGQWHLIRGENGQLTIEDGLPPTNNPVLRIASQELIDLIRSRRCCAAALVRRVQPLDHNVPASDALKIASNLFSAAERAAVSVDLFSNGLRQPSQAPHVAATES
ncbi:MAG: SDR family oxidoreductase [Pirellulales bacterium]